MTDPNATTGAATPDPGTANTDPNAAAAAPAAAPAAEPQKQEPAAPVVPESYEFKMPDGVTLDKAAADEFTAVAKELKLDQATAQKVADVGAKMAQRQAEQRTAEIASWAEQTKADPEIGGEKLAANLAIAQRAIDRFGGDALKEVLNATGLGNHPVLVKAFLKAGQAISEDGSLPRGTASAEVDAAKKLFPNMN